MHDSLDSIRLDSVCMYVPGTYDTVRYGTVHVHMQEKMCVQVALQDGLQRDVSDLQFYVLSRASKTRVREKLKEKVRYVCS